MRLLLIFLFLFTIISCGKNGNENSLTFKGIVTDYSTNARVPNTIIKLIRSQGYIPGSGYYDPVFDSTITNANGEFELVVGWVAGKTMYNIEVQKPGYSFVAPFCAPRIASRLLISNQDTYYDSLLVDKSTIIHIVLNNLLPGNSTDTLDVSLNHIKICNSSPVIIGEGFRTEKQFIGIVSNQYFSDTFSLKATPNVTLKWTVRNNGIISTNEQSITPAEFGTTVFNLNY